MLRFFFSPFIFVYEVIAFVIQAAFVYGLVLIAAFSMLAWVITSNPAPEIKYVEIPVETVEEVTGFVCERLDGCRVEWDKFGTEFCPTCVNK